MILQLGGLFSGLFTGLGGVLTEAVGSFGKELVPAAVDIGKSLLARELTRTERRREKDAMKAQARELSNLLGQGPAVPQTAPVPTGGRVFQPPFLIPNVIPPSSAPPVLQTVGAPQRTIGRIESRIARGLGALPPRVGPFAGPLTLGPAIESVLPPGATPFQTLFPQGVAPMFRGRAMPNGNGLMPRVGRPLFQRSPTGGVQHFVIDTRSGSLVPIELAGDPTGRTRFRFDVTTQNFIKIKPRRMNPLNFKAYGRARRRTQALLNICRTAFTEARREKTGRVRPKRRVTRRRKSK